MTAIRTPPSTSTLRPSTTSPAQQRPGATARAPETRNPIVKLYEGQSDCVIEVKGTNSGGNSTGTKVGSDGTCVLPERPVVIDL